MSKKLTTAQLLTEIKRHEKLIMKELTKRFYSLSITDQYKVVAAYLAKNSSATDKVKLLPLLERAQVEQRLAEVWRLVEDQYGTPKDVPNPFKEII